MPERLDLADNFPVTVQNNPFVMAFLESPEASYELLDEQLSILGVLQRKYLTDGQRSNKAPTTKDLKGLKSCFYHFICPNKGSIDANFFGDLCNAFIIFLDIKKRERIDSGDANCLDIAHEMLSDASLTRSFLEACFRGEKKGTQLWIDTIEESDKGKKIPKDKKINRILHKIASLLNYKNTTLYSVLREDSRYFKLVSTKIRRNFECVVNGDCEGIQKNREIAKIVREMQSDISLIRAFLDAYFRMTGGRLGEWHRLLQITEDNDDLKADDPLRDALETLEDLLGYGKHGVLYSALRADNQYRRGVARKIRIQLSQAIELKDQEQEMLKDR